MTSHLAPELLDDIFSYLHATSWDSSDCSVVRKPHLASCSLVCREWSIVARPRLFRDIVFSFRPVPYDAVLNDQGDYMGTRPKYDSFHPTLKPDVRYKTFPMFCAFIQQSPLAQNSIRRLRLDGWPRGQGAFLHDADRIYAAAFTQLLHLLPGLRVLHLYNVGIAHPYTRKPPISHPSLRRVFIVNAGDTDTLMRSWPDIDVPAILDCFARIEELQLRFPVIPRFDTAPREGWPAMEVDRLILDDTSHLDDGLFDYLFQVRHVGKVRELCAHYLSPDSAIDLLAEVRFEVLRIATDEPGEYDDLEGMFDLSFFTEMKHLVLDMPFNLAQNNTPALQGTAVTMLEELARAIGLSNTAGLPFTHLSLYLDGMISYCAALPPGQTDPIPADQQDLEAFESVLSHIIRQHNLPGVEFILDGTNPHSLSTKDAEDVLKKCCPNLAAQGKLIISWNPEGDPFDRYNTDRFLK